MRWRSRKQRELDLERELHSCFEAAAEEFRQSGLTDEQARQAAQRAFGNRTAVKEQVREVWGWTWLDRLRQDITYAARTFARAKGFTATVVLTLALGIGATTAMFSVVDAVLLHPLPLRNPDRLVVIWLKSVRDPDSPPFFDTYRDFEVWKKGSRSFERLTLATWRTDGQILTGSGRARDVFAMPVGVDFFPMLGIEAALGRTFLPDDLNAGCTVVLKHSFWMEISGGRKNVIGTHIELSRNSCTIVGVMPPAFAFYPDAAAMWILITPAGPIVRDPSAPVGVFALLKSGVPMAERSRK